MKRTVLQQSHVVGHEGLSLQQRFQEIIERLSFGETVIFYELFPAHEGRLGVVVTFIAILELLKQKLIELVQNGFLEPIYVRQYDEAAA